MNTDIKEFCEKYLEKLRMEKEEEEQRKKRDKNSPNYASLLRRSISFSVFVSDKTMAIGGYGRQLMYLDEEDLKYLHDKYAKKLQSEMEDNIKEIKEMYELKYK